MPSCRSTRGGLIRAARPHGAPLRGFTASVYRLGDLLAETFGGTEWDRVEVTLIDVSSRADPVVIADLPARVSAPRDQASAAPAATTLPLDVYGRTWELTVRPTSTAFVDSHGSVTVILLLVALALTFMLEAFLLVLSGMNALARRLMSELSSADRYIASILPSDLEAPVPVASRYVPPGNSAGTASTTAGSTTTTSSSTWSTSPATVASALLSVTVHNLLRSGTLDIDTLRDPGEVLTELNRLFQMEEHAGNYFTIWYGVYQPSTHAEAIPARTSPNDRPDRRRLRPRATALESIPIGVMEDSTFETRHCTVNPDTALLIYSDGAFDLTLRDGRRTLDDFISLCARTATKPGWTLDDLIDQIRNRSTSGLFDDDCTLVRVSIR